jgi:hypothetical protein
MILYIHRDNKKKYLKIGNEFKRFMKKKSVQPVLDDSIFIVSVGLDQKMQGGGILIPANSEAAVLSFLEVSKTLSIEDKETTSFEICAAIQEYCLINKIFQVSANASIQLEDWLKRHGWHYKTLIGRRSIKEKSIISLEISYDQFVSFVFDGNINPAFACNSPDRKKQKLLVA